MWVAKFIKEDWPYSGIKNFQLLNIHTLSLQYWVYSQFKEKNKVCIHCYTLGLEQRLKFNLRTFIDKIDLRFEASVLQHVISL